MRVFRFTWPDRPDYVFFVKALEKASAREAAVRHATWKGLGKPSEGMVA